MCFAGTNETPCCGYKMAIDRAHEACVKYFHSRKYTWPLDLTFYLMSAGTDDARDHEVRLSILKFAVAHGCPLHPDTASAAAFIGNWTAMFFAMESGCEVHPYVVTGLHRSSKFDAIFFLFSNTDFSWTDVEQQVEDELKDSRLHVFQADSMLRHLRMIYDSCGCGVVVVKPAKVTFQ